MIIVAKHVGIDGTTLFVYFTVFYFTAPYLFVVFYPDISEFLRRLKMSSKKYQQECIRDGEIAKENPYAVFGLDYEASDEEVKKSYYAVMQQYHPDHVEHLDDVKKKIALEMTKNAIIAFSRIRKERGF